MLSCRDIAPLLDELVDGTIDAARASGVRGHLRECRACTARFADLEAMVVAAHTLGPLDPPPSVWEGVRRQLAADEARAAARPKLWWWWQAQKSWLAWGGAVAALALVAVMTWQWKHAGLPLAAELSVPTPVVPRAVASSAPAPANTQDDDAMTSALHEVATADAEYARAVGELEKLVASERPRWPAAAARSYDANLATIDAAVARQRAAFRATPGDVRALDALQASYHARIDFLQEAVVRGGTAEVAR